MEGLIGPPLAASLKRGRDRFNARYAQARRDFPRLDGEVFLECLRRRVDPIVSVAAEQDAAPLDELVDALYEATLEMLGKGLIGPHARHADFETLWAELMLAIAPSIARWPGELVGPLTNGLYNMVITPRCRQRDWQRLFSSVAPDCASAAQLLAAGQIAAWVCGMAHYRDPALALARVLPTGIVAKLLLSNLVTQTPTPPAQVEASPAVLTQVIDRLAADPWFHPRSFAVAGRVELRIVAEVGGFRGLGGEFLRPPSVAARDDRLYASDGTSLWLLTADAFGAIFHRVANKLLKHQSHSPYSAKSNGICRGPTCSASLPLLAGAKSAAATATTLAVTLPMSHRIFLVSETNA